MVTLTLSESAEICNEIQQYSRRATQCACLLQVLRDDLAKNKLAIISPDINYRTNQVILEYASLPEIPLREQSNNELILAEEIKKVKDYRFDFYNSPEVIELLRKNGYKGE